VSGCDQHRGHAAGDHVMVTGQGTDVHEENVVDGVERANGGRQSRPLRSRREVGRKAQVRHAALSDTVRVISHGFVRNAELISIEHQPPMPANNALWYVARQYERSKYGKATTIGS